MATTLDPKTEARIADLSQRLGLRGQDAPQLVLRMALDQLDAKTPRRRRKPTPAEIAATLRELERISAVGRRWREEHPDEYDESNPPSKAWQDELYDENGLPR